jgi:GTP-binding protein EngB required for normal cell division
MLKPLHKQALLSTFLHIESRLKEMEAMLARGKRPSPLDQHVHDLSPTEVKVVEDYFARIRSTMVTCLEKHGIPIEVSHVSLRWSLQTAISFLSVAVAEVSPDRLRGYGELDDAGRKEVLNIQQELDRLLDRVRTYLSDRLGHNLPERIARLDAAPGSVAMLSLLNQVVMRWQLVEFRPVIDTIVQRLESPQFEIAVFGRVSSGKSSLLNHIAGSAILPVGVTPVTAVPTRLVRGHAPSATVYFAEYGPRSVDPKQLAEYASEEKNRGNHKHVTGIVVEVPSRRLPEGVVLVDTPGIGSLATSGSAETFAYLPRCDLSVVLIDAGSTLNQDDLSLLRDLYEAGIPAQVLLSKADLLAAEDRERFLQYIRDQLRQELNLDMAVHPVSVMGGDAKLLDCWFEQEIEPLWERHRTLTEKSLHRKIARLQESVASVLRTLLAKRRGTAPVSGDGREIKNAERLLDQADGAIERAETRRRDWSGDTEAFQEIILQDAAKAIVEAARKGGKDESSPVGQVVGRSFARMGQMAREVVTDLQQKLLRTLESLERTAPLATVDTSAIRNAAYGGLPAIDLAPLLASCEVTIPRWALIVPALAQRMARSTVEKRLADQVEHYVKLYNAQLQSWLKDSIAQVVEPYQSQAEVFREQLRRMTASDTGSAGEGETAELIRDLQELEQTASGETTAAVGKEASHLPPANGDGSLNQSPQGMAATKSN